MALLLLQLYSNLTSFQPYSWPGEYMYILHQLYRKKTKKKKKPQYNDPTKVIDDWLLTARVGELFGRVCAFINGGKSYLTLTWCCALNLIMIITIITNTDNIFQSDSVTLMNQSKMEYISVHFHQRLRGSSFWEIYQRAFWLCSHCIQFKLVFQTILQVMKSDFFSFRRSSSIEVAIVIK